MPPEMPVSVLWNPAVEYPSPQAMPDLDVVTHVSVERAQRGSYHYLHETSLAWHEDRLWLCWANHPTQEVNTRDELIRGTCSLDGGLTWEAPTIWVPAHANGADGYNHAVITSAFGQLWGFFTRWDNEVPSMEVFRFEQNRGAWHTTGFKLPQFIPFRPPTRMSNGDWIIGGEQIWDEGAVAISKGDDFSQWEMVVLPREESFALMYPEVTLMERGEDMVAILRPKDTKTAPVSLSKDYGRTWSAVESSNYPMGKSQPCCGRLSTGQQYLIANHPDEGRTLLSIAVTRPGEDTFCRVWKIRHQANPVIRLLGHRRWNVVGGATQWSYPSALEHAGNLYISYTQGKEDCALSIIPIRVLAV